MSILIIPVKQSVLRNELVKIWSIMVALDLEALVGLQIIGINRFWKTMFK